MSSFVSRLVIALVLLPVVLGAVYLGGWWVFALVAIAVAVSLHEYWLMARSLAPLAPAGYIGAALGLVGAELSGVVWMLGGILATFPLAFLLKAISEARPAATAAVSATVMGALWIGGGLAFFILLRGLPQHGGVAPLAGLVAGWGGGTPPYFRGRALRPPPQAPAELPRET